MKDNQIGKYVIVRTYSAGGADVCLGDSATLAKGI